MNSNHQPAASAWTNYKGEKSIKSQTFERVNVEGAEGLKWVKTFTSILRLFYMFWGNFEIKGESIDFCMLKHVTFFKLQLLFETPFHCTKVISNLILIFINVKSPAC